LFGSNAPVGALEIGSDPTPNETPEKNLKNPTQAIDATGDNAEQKKKSTLELILGRPFGFPKFFDNHLLLRMEDKKNFKSLIYKEYFKHIPPKLIKMLGPITSSMQTRYTINVYRLHLLNTYKG